MLWLRLIQESKKVVTGSRGGWVGVCVTVVANDRVLGFIANGCMQTTEL